MNGSDSTYADADAALYGPQTFSLARWVASVLPVPGIVHRVVLCAVGSLQHDPHGNVRVVDVEAVAGLTRLDRELVVGALTAAAAEGLVELTASGKVWPIQEPEQIDPEAQERHRYGLEQDCSSCGAGAGSPCTSNRNRPTGHHQPRRSAGARRFNQERQAAA